MGCNDIFITKIITTATGVVLIPNRTVLKNNLANRGKYDLIMACGLNASASLPVFIQTDQGNIPVLDKYANVVYSNQLKTRTRYCVGYGNDNTTVYNLGQFVIFNNLCAGYNSTVTTAAAAANIAANTTATAKK